MMWLDSRTAPHPVQYTRTPCTSATARCEKVKTVLELYDLEIHQKKAGPDYHRLKTMVKRSIEQDLRNNNVGARNGNYERNAVVKNQRATQREKRSLGDCWQWKTNGAVF